MVPSEEVLEAERLALLRKLCGGLSALRVLSDRRGRTVYLVADGDGRRRIFKVVWNLPDPELERLVVHTTAVQAAAAGGNLMPILRHGSEKSHFWIEMPVADGLGEPDCAFEDYSPRSILPDRSRLHGSTEVAAVGLGVVDALLDLRSAGLQHGDVKPTNVLSVGGRWVLTDFDTVAGNDSALAATASTEGYIPPGGDRALGRDSYALGKLLYELWTGNSRLEYPAVPRGMLTAGLWNRRDRLLNRTIHALCSPLGSRRLRDLTTVRTVLQSISSPGEEGIRRAELLVHGRRNRRFAGAAVLAAATMAVALGLWVRGKDRLPPGSFQGTLGDEGVVWTPYHNDQGLNQGYAQRALHEHSTGWILFNSHGSLTRPLVSGDQVEIEFRKEIWRGHVALYLSPQPFYLNPDAAAFGHREGFNGLDHLLWCHIDGDRLVPPTRSIGGKPTPLDPTTWNESLATHSLGTYRALLRVEPELLRWRISVDDVLLSTGHCRRPYNPTRLGVYVFDNTLCYLTEVKVTRPDPASSESP